MPVKRTHTLDGKAAVSFTRLLGHFSNPKKHNIFSSATQPITTQITAQKNKK